jgi:hypothetical protein
VQGKEWQAFWSKESMIKQRTVWQPLLKQTQVTRHLDSRLSNYRRYGTHDPPPYELALWVETFAG